MRSENGFLKCFSLAVMLCAAAACGTSDKPGAADSPAAVPPPVALTNPDSAKLAAPAPAQFQVLFETSKGNFTVTAHRDWAPIGVDRFHYLVSNGFFDEVRFFRAMQGFMVQFGISGTPQIAAAWQDLRIPDDPVKMGNTRGRISYATSGPNSRTTQMFINLVDNSPLDAQGFAAFGEVTEGMAVIDSLFMGYGETPNQGEIARLGNTYLASNFPQLDYIKSARVITPATGGTH